jgi:hypothetical protein
MVLTLIAEALGSSAILYAGVAWLKQYGVQGKNLTLASLIFGVVIGLIVRYIDKPMITLIDWLVAALFGLICGLIASGAYKAQEDLAQKAACANKPT